MLFGSSLPRFAYNSKWFGKTIHSVFSEPNTGTFSTSANIPLNSGIDDLNDSLSLSLSQDTAEQIHDTNSSSCEEDHILIIGSQQHRVRFGQGISLENSVDDHAKKNDNDPSTYTPISQTTCAQIVNQNQSKITEDEMDKEYQYNIGILKSAEVAQELAAILIQSASIDEVNASHEQDEFIPVITSLQFPLKIPNALSKPPKSILKSIKSTPVLSETDLIQKTARLSPELLHINNRCDNLIKKHQVKFDSCVYVGDAVPPSEYERRGDYIARCLTPELAFFIKKELNEVKSEMEIHECSRQNTQFYSV